MVPMVGLEPTRLSPLPPQDSVSTNSTTSAKYLYSVQEGYIYLYNCCLVLMVADLLELSILGYLVQLCLKDQLWAPEILLKQHN